MPTPHAQRQFGGIAPRIGARLLSEHLGQSASNAKLFSGELRSWPQPYYIATPTKAAKGKVLSVFRMNLNTSQDIGTAAGTLWLDWLTDVNCVRLAIGADTTLPVDGDTTQRIAWTGDGEPRESNYTLAAIGTDFPGKFYVLGVALPVAAPTVTTSGGSASNVTRVYVYTWVTAWGEEGPPSPPTTLTGHPDGTWQLSNMDVLPPSNGTVTGFAYASGVATVALNSTQNLRAGEQITLANITVSGGGMSTINGTFPIASVVDSTHITVAVQAPGTYSSGGTWVRVAPHNITGRNIYRVLTSATSAQYQLVNTSGPINPVVGAAGSTGGNQYYTDSTADSALGAAMVSTNYYQPPTNLSGLIALPNQALCGFAGNILCFSEQGKPWAWNPNYQQATDYPIVGIGFYQDTVVVGTQGQPYRAQGQTPAAIAFNKIDGFTEPCLSKRSLVSLPYGVMYASPNGLVLIGVEGAMVSTQPIMTHLDWANYGPATLRSAVYQGRYFGFYDGTPNGGGFMYDHSEGTPVFIPLNQTADGVYEDPENNNLYLLSEGQILMWDNPAYNWLNYDWVSKVFALPKWVNFGAARVGFDYASLQNSSAQQAQKAMDAAFNATVLARTVTPSYGGTTKTLGCLNDTMLGGFGTYSALTAGYPSVTSDGFALQGIRLNGSLLRDGTYSSYQPRFLNFTLYADRGDGLGFVAVATQNVTNQYAFRLPDSYMASEFYYELTGNLDLHWIQVGETMTDLREAV